MQKTKMKKRCRDGVTCVVLCTLPSIYLVYVVFGTVISTSFYIFGKCFSYFIFIDCSREHAGKMDSECIECNAVRISENRRVPTEMLKKAFNTIANQLPSLVLSNSSVVSGTYPMVYIRTSTVLCALM